MLKDLDEDDSLKKVYITSVKKQATQVKSEEARDGLIFALPRLKPEIDLIFIEGRMSEPVRRRVKKILVKS